jgi:geranylgeranyl transferase type-1 subunit beta
VDSLRGQDTNPIVRGTQASQSLPSLISPSAGLTYCAISALAFLNNTPEDWVARPDPTRYSGISLTDCIRWTVGRQTNHLEEDETETEEQTSQLPQPEPVPLPSSPLGSPHATQFPATAHSPPKPLPAAGAQISTKGTTSNATEQDLRWAGFNGRPNKIADTCYCFWNTGALAVRTLSLSRRCFANRTK